MCDKFIGDDEQRGGAIVTDRPMVEADGEFLPFADRAFDYVICSHVLEHVEDPRRFISELMRVACRGYIETPSEIGERIYGWHYHHWVVNLVDGCLMLRKNEKKSQFGQLFHRLAVTDKHWKQFHITHHNLFLVQYEWEDEIDYKILLEHESALDLECHDTLDRLVASDSNIPRHNEWFLFLKSAVPRSIVSRVKSLLAKETNVARRKHCKKFSSARSVKGRLRRKNTVSTAKCANSPIGLLMEFRVSAKYKPRIKSLKNVLSKPTTAACGTESKILAKPILSVNA